MSSRAFAHRRTWALFVGSVLALAVAMAALSVAVLRGERRERIASAAAAHDERLRLAAAAMDRWLGPVIAREAGRHHSDYASYRAPRRVFTSDLARLPSGSVVEPSPLLGHGADTILLHLEWSAESGARSPQVPLGRERELALASGLPPEILRVAEERLESALSRLDLPEMARSVRAEAPAATSGPGGGAEQAACLSSDELAEGPLSPGFVEDSGGASVGPLVARWFGDDGLLFARDVWFAVRDDQGSGGGGAVQLVIADWPALSRLLLSESARELPGARLERGDVEHGGQRARGARLATLPAVLVADEPPPPALAWTPWATRLSLAWLAGLVSVGAIGWALRASIGHAERRARFAAAVSHELRTPLTTLRMYSEMLADGVITDPSVKQEYLQTIQAESARLASLVENVLLHAKVEQAPMTGRRRMPVGQLVESVLPVLRRRAGDSGRPLVTDLDIDPSLEVEVDRDAVERVLFNLVDNACKHGADAEDGTLELEVRRRASFVDLHVRDHGPGIPRELGTAVFEAFRRGDDTGAPGVGLGLALSRSLARELHGELSLVPSDRGACFRLSLRLA